jgi:hypothetical protein
MLGQRGLVKSAPLNENIVNLLSNAYSGLIVKIENRQSILASRFPLDRGRSLIPDHQVTVSLDIPIGHLAKLHPDLLWIRARQGQ